MNDHDKENYVWREYWISSEATKSQRQFVRIDDTQTVSEWLRPPTDKNISVSTGIYAEPRQESTYCAPLYFEISGEQFARLCHCAKKVLFYMQKHWKIPGNCVEVICDANTTLTLIVPPVVFDCPPNPLMDEINFHLAHTLMEAGFAEIDVEIYKKEYYLPVPNSRRMVSDRPFVVALSAEELRLSPTKIQKLAEKQRWPACPAQPRRIAER